MNIMNLFNYMRYKYINLTNWNSLNDLPEELLNMYWHKAGFTRAAHTEDIISKSTRCVLLVSWMETHQSDSKEILKMKECFDISLRQYCDKPV